MRWPRLARKDVRDAMRSWSLYGVVGLFLLVGGLAGYFASDPAVVPLTLAFMTFLVPVVALGLTYESVAGPRSSGSLQFLLALPYDRRDVVLGTLAGRFAVLGAGVAVGYLTMALALLLQGVLVSPGTLLVVLGLVFVLAAVFVAVGTGVSTAVRSTTVAGVAAFLVFFLVFLAWPAVPGVVAYVLNGFATPPSPPSWAPAFQALNPLSAFRVLAAELLTAGALSPGVGSDAVRSLPLSAAVLVGWTVLVPLAGYLRFRGDDL